FLADAGLGRAGVRAVRQAAGVQRDAALLDALARHEVALDIVQHLVAVDIRVIIWRRDRQRVVVELARHERAEYEVWPFERLVYRRRLMNAPGNRLEILDIEGPRVQIAIPADRVKRVVIENMQGVAVARAYQHRELARFVVAGQLERYADVALAV